MTEDMYSNMRTVPNERIILSECSTKSLTRSHNSGYNSMFVPRKSKAFSHLISMRLGIDELKGIPEKTGVTNNNLHKLRPYTK